MFINYHNVFNVAHTSERMKEYSVHEVDQQKHAIIIDVRTAGEYRTAHIKGSFNVPLNELAEHISTLKTYSEPIIVVCRTSNRSSIAANALHEMGLDDVGIMRGGIHSWERAGYTVVYGEKHISMERQVRIFAGSMVLVTAILGFVLHNILFLITALIGSALVYSGVTDTCHAAQFLAQLPYNKNVDKNPLPKRR